jgi:hypothetical protein
MTLKKCLVAKLALRDNIKYVLKIKAYNENLFCLQETDMFLTRCIDFTRKDHRLGCIHVNNISFDQKVTN